MCFPLRENKVAVTEEKCVEESISLVSLKEDTHWVKQVYYVQSRSGLLVKLRLPSECPSSQYDKATMKQKSNTVKFPHHPPCTLPNLWFSLPPLSSLPQSKSLFCKTIGLTRKFILCMQRKQSKNCFNYKRSKFLRNIGTFEEPGKTTVFDWWREFRFGSKYREFKKKPRVREIVILLFFTDCSEQ